MKRNDFFKKLAGVSLLALSPSNLMSLTIEYKKVYLKQCFVRGFAYYNGPKILNEINRCSQVELVSEPDNKFDKKAIAIHFNQQKIGYLPRESNKNLSILMDTKLLDFHAEITHIKPEAESWEQVRIVVFALKEIKTNTDRKLTEQYQILFTPTYNSIISENNRVIRCYSNPQKN